MKQMDEWIDYIEGEAPTWQITKMNLLLNHSFEDRQTVANLKMVKDLVWQCDVYETVKDVVEEPEFLEKNHALIMKKLERLWPEDRRQELDCAPSDGSNESSLAAMSIGVDAFDR
jgi:hypothetical protein